MTELVDEPAAVLLKAYFAAMCNWETDFHAELQSIDYATTTEEIESKRSQRWRNKLEEIFEKYCEAGVKAKRLRDKGLSCMSPPTHHPENEVILSLSQEGSKIVIETKQNYGFKAKRRYELLTKSGVWKIKDNVKKWSELRSKWETDLL